MHDLIPFLSDLIGQVTRGGAFLIPEIILVLFFLLAILIELFFPGKRSLNTLVCSVFGLVIAGISVVLHGNIHPDSVLLFDGTIVFDDIANYLQLICFFSLCLFSVFVWFNKDLQEHKKGMGDLYIIVPALAIGLGFMGKAINLLYIYITIEMVSLASYLMVGYVSKNRKDTEAATKYVLFGSVCSAMMLYGISLLYGYTGTITLSDSAFISGLSAIPALPLSIALTLFMVGVGFKLSFVPLHFWSPDVYEGAPTPVTALLSTAPKAAGIILLYRLVVMLDIPILNDKFDIHLVLGGIAILSMMVGNFVALNQDNVKRMLAYSSIGHTGFIMMAILAHQAQANHAIKFYITIYVLMNMAAFMLANHVEERTGVLSIKAYRGLGGYLKGEMVCFVLVLISLTGLPPLAGFVSKFLVFSSLLEVYNNSHKLIDLLLLITGALTTVVALFYYIKIPMNAYLRNQSGEVDIQQGSRMMYYIILMLSLSLLLLGIFPGLLSGIL